MLISNGIVFIWTGTHAAIPTGWSRFTDMDNKFLKGAANGANGNTTAGATTHTHTSEAHTHSISAHTHSIIIAAGINYNTDANTSSTGQPFGTPGPHTHANYNSGAAQSGSVSSNTSTYATCSNNPPNYTVIYVTPTTNVSVLPAGMVALADAAAPTGFNVCDGNNSTPNLVNKYLLGANTGANAGTTAGSSTNIHELTHTHTTSHSHANATSGDHNSANSGRVESGGTSALWGGHSHTPTVAASTPSSSDTPSLTTAETVEPTYKKLLAIHNTAEQAPRKGIIALFFGTIANIPKHWQLVDMYGKYLKITATVGEIGNTGGSNTHSHASQNHTHTVSHSHTSNNMGHTGNIKNRTGGGGTTANSSTYHTTSTSTDNMTLADAATTGASASNEPEHRTALFIKLIKTIDDSAFLFNFL